ncbi:hypothetical protein CROQUDRAFT_90848 [Cronartium quercuum f. sp. fusiforme G11]|uniref:Uncharacterized protein n=1 Tax=Cronartium quercuum f. sp. fusiforme G11 TaxID=708437 RepID=A0A9P6NPL9_9BASI|nr:hypothetical protein CROQUDRAFT_90848 [Cronartium quercuum f. sp. fusiforme G11]
MWPWVNCVAKLANWGLQLAFTEEAKTNLTFLSWGSNNLNDKNAAIIVDDLKHKRITLTKNPKDSLGLKKRAARGTGKSRKKQKVTVVHPEFFILSILTSAPDVEKDEENIGDKDEKTYGAETE